MAKTQRRKRRKRPKNAGHRPLKTRGSEKPQHDRQSRFAQLLRGVGGQKPGQSALCRDCRHYLPELAEQGHPTPCSRVRWDGAKHLTPTLDGEGCPDFEEIPRG